MTRTASSATNFILICPLITLRTFIEQEQPRINAALAEAAAELPVSIMPIAQYAMGNGGKRLRPLLTVLVARLLGYADNDIYPLAAAMEMFHVATLLHDDVMDNAEMRRGSTATHKVFGVTETILAGDALLAKGNQIVAGFGDPRLTAATSDAIAQTANGEILEIANQGKNAPDLLIYNQIIAGKTAWMIRTSCNIGAVRANGTPEQVAGATDYGFNLGMALQIVDDALDFAPSSLTGKPEGGRSSAKAKLTPAHTSSMPTHWLRPSVTPSSPVSRNSSPLPTKTSGTSLIPSALQGFDDKTRGIADTYSA